MEWKESIDPLLAEMDVPYTQNEVEVLAFNSEFHVSGVLIRIRQHHLSMIRRIVEWRKYITGKGPKPSDELARFLIPGRNIENPARLCYEDVTSFYTRFAHGQAPRFDILRETSKSGLSLIQTGATLFKTENLAKSEEGFRSMMHLLAYKGKPQMRQDEFSRRIVESRERFLDEFAAYAYKLALWITSPDRAFPGAEIPVQKTLLERQDELRHRAVALIKAYRKANDCTWNHAEETVRKALYDEFTKLGLKAQKNNIHQLRYALKFRDTPAASPEELRNSCIF